MSTRFRVAIGLFTLLLAVLLIREWRLQPDGKLHVAFFDIGQGDSALITLPDGKQILVDGGPDWAALERLGEYMPFFDRHIDLLILSHPHLDHYLSFPEVLRRYSVGSLVLADTPSNAGRYQSILATAEKKNVPITIMYAGKSFDFAGTTVDFLWPPKELPTEFTKTANNESLVFRLEYKGKRILFTGDAEELVEKTLVAAKVDLKADILKVGHHGSNSSSSTGFLLAVAPSMSIISAGKDNQFRHPRPEIIQRLQQFGGEVRRTDLEGTVEVVW